MKIDLDKIKHNNTKLKLANLGKVELKFISIGDLGKLLKILANKKLNDKEFVRAILYNQLLQPQIEFRKFKELSNGDLTKITNSFVKVEKDTFRYFKDTGDLFKDFRIAIQTYKEKQVEHISKSLEPIIKSTQETLKAINKNYSSLLQQSFVASSYIKDSFQGITKVAEQIKRAHVSIAESCKPIIERYQLNASILNKSLMPHIDHWQKWVNQHTSIFKNEVRYWADLQKKYNIAQKKAAPVLAKYKWFITPSLPATFVFSIMQLDKKEGRQDKAVNKLFVDYFSSNNWRNLERLVNKWRNKPLLKKRITILTDCVQTLKKIQNKKINEASVVLPTLITQIDGALTDYLNLKGIQYDCAYDDVIQSGRVRKVGRKSQFQMNRSRVLSTQLLDDLANDIFLNILFQKSQTGQPLRTPFNFNRHKIIHGENIKYGRKDYLVRAFMVLDFLAHLK